MQQSAMLDFNQDIAFDLCRLFVDFDYSDSKMEKL